MQKQIFRVIIKFSQTFNVTPIKVSPSANHQLIPMTLTQYNLMEVKRDKLKTSDSNAVQVICVKKEGKYLEEKHTTIATCRTKSADVSGEQRGIQEALDYLRDQTSRPVWQKSSQKSHPFESNENLNEIKLKPAAKVSYYISAILQQEYFIFLERGFHILNSLPF